MRKIFAAMGILCLAGCSSTGIFSRPPPDYAVFFDAHNVTLTQDGRKIVDDVAAEAKLHGDKTVQISGPSTKAAPGYDPGVAEARIHLVEQTLIEDGIASGRLVRASSTTAGLKAGATDAQRVEIKLIAKPAS